MASNDPESAAKLADELARAAEDEAKAAEARAEAARARAAELRQRIEAADRDTQPETEPPTETDPEPGLNPPRQTTVAVLPAVAVGAAALVSAGLLASAGYMAWQHHKHNQQRHSAAEFAAAARQDVINLMSIDYNSAQDSVQRVLDSSTGRFHDNFADTADDFIKALKDEKIVTKAVVNDTAVESMSGDSAVVLVSATSQREGEKAPKDQQDPRIWRISVTLERDGDQIKMSGVDFV